MDQMMAMARLADEAGLDVLGVGEHHGLRYVNSATATMIAAMAAVTKRIRFTSGTTLISTADPVRIFQEFATADLVSHGRVEIIVGRGAFTDQFGLFGFDMQDYDELFTEKLALLLQLNASERVTWRGKFRPALNDAEIAPRPAQPRLPITIGAGRPESAARAGRLGLPLAIPMLGGSIAGYAAVAESYRKAFRVTADGPDRPSVSVFSHLVVEESGDLAKNFLPYYSAYLQPLFKGPMPRQAFEQMLSPEGSLIGGSVQQVIDKILYLRERTGCDRYLGQIDIGGQPFARVMQAIEIFAAKVAPVIRKSIQ
jgi:alkanesulfonate monooxygenase SsuD/methylene tetrahydromethanopterin reductase-like flavin-dependent oxidoreductase (luciferase family)